MIYPKFLQNGSTIGIAAPSAGVGDDIGQWEESCALLQTEGFFIKETESVRNVGDRSADAVTRAKELGSLFSDSEVDFVMCAAGGDFLDECLPYVDLDLMRANPKWLMGASDPTGILYPYTTKCDVATIYGLNAGSYSRYPVPDYVKDNLSLIKGESLTEKSYPMYMSIPPFASDDTFYDRPSDMTCSRDYVSARGRCIGGCIDVLKDLIGTPFDATKDFLSRYKDDHFIWYFDNFSLGAEAFYRTLLQMRYAGWFDDTEAVIVGRTLFESSDTGLSYREAAEMALGDIPVIHRADIGHTLPHFTMINGAMMELVYKDSQMDITFSLV